jgi:hypothetical protein
MNCAYLDTLDMPRLKWWVYLYDSLIQYLESNKQIKSDTLTEFVYSAGYCERLINK